MTAWNQDAKKNKQKPKTFHFHFISQKVVDIYSSNARSHFSCYTRNLFSDQNLNIWFSSLCFSCVQKVSNKVILLCVSLPRNVANFGFKVSPSHLRGRTRRGRKANRTRKEHSTHVSRWGRYSSNI